MDEKNKKRESKEISFLSYNKIFPNCLNLFYMNIPEFKEIWNNCVFVLDTNCLLVLYKNSSDSLSEITNVYKNLINSSEGDKIPKIMLPGHVIREFMVNREEMIQNIYEEVKKMQDTDKFHVPNIPILEEMPEFKQYKENIEKGKEIAKIAKKNAIELQDQIKKWGTNDIIWKAYQEIFSKNVIYELDLSPGKRKDLFNDMKYRYEHKIPPGYEDGGKDKNSEGDFIIWKTILEFGKKYQKNIIFITQDSKKDWYLKSNKDVIFPKFELIEEFYRVTNGKFFTIINFREFLEKSNVKTEIIKEMKLHTENKNLFNEPLEDIYSIAEWVTSQTSGHVDFDFTDYHYDMIGISSHVNYYIKNHTLLTNAIIINELNWLKEIVLSINMPRESILLLSYQAASKIEKNKLNYISNRIHIPNFKNLIIGRLFDDSFYNIEIYEI